MLEYITSYLSQPVTPGEAGNYFWAAVYVAVVIGGVSGVVLGMNWGERKALAHMQVRLGPMRVGPHGLLQPFADALKLEVRASIRGGLIASQVPLPARIICNRISGVGNIKFRSDTQTIGEMGAGSGGNNNSH